VTLFTLFILVAIKGQEGKVHGERRTVEVIHTMINGWENPYPDPNISKT
jgi:hypothetical protein